ncbi:MAG: beta galactosidase jelly roll domain-containing protein, partial [Candidatus Latescibacteria bacterium]|nr:beta galactosidase jelly roll domain-containing protein [Candidatus Latescibacterota bacterium]
MATNEMNNDVFAGIAAQRVTLRDATLIEPKPPKLANTILPLDNTDARFPLRPARKLDTPPKLQRELERQRRKHEKFLRDLAPAPEKTRITVPLETFDWRIETERDRGDFAHTPAGQGSWEAVRIPHYGAPVGKAVTYYRTRFEVTKAMMDRGALFLHFGGVDYKAHVFVNGAYLDSHEGFFAPFEVEFTPHAHPGENTLLVKVENDAICMGNASWGADGKSFEGDKIYAATGPGYDDPEVGWHHCPPGMGIYQDVFVEARAPLFIHDIFVRPIV